MGVKGFFHPKIGGGCPSFMPFLHIARGLPSCLPSSSLVVNFQPIGANFQQKVAKVNFSLVCLGVFSGILETKKGKSEIYFGFGAFVVALSLGGGGVHWVQAVGSCGSSCFRAVFPAFCPLVCFALLLCLSNMPLFRVLRGF